MSIKNTFEILPLRPILLFLSLTHFCVMPITAESAPHPRFGGQLRHAIFQRVTTLDGVNYLNFSELQVAFNLYNGIVQRDRFGRIVSAIAQSWTHSEDYRVWTFTIAPDAKFHDGVPVRATDIKEAWERTVRESWLGMALFPIEEAEDATRIQVLDERHLRVTLKAGDPEFLAKLTAPTAWITKPGDSQPIGTGRFRIASYSPEKTVLAANTDYVWGRPYLEELHFHFYPHVRQALFDFESGVLDALHLPLTEAEKRRRENLNERSVQTEAAIGVYLQVKSGLDALKYAIDVEELLRLQYGTEFAQLALVASPSLYNPTKARRRLKSNPQPPRMIYAPLPDNMGIEIATRLTQDYFAQLGLQVAKPDELQQPLKDATADLVLLAVPRLFGIDSPPGMGMPLYFLPSNFLCQPQVRGINIGWGGVIVFDEAWLASR